MPGQPLRLSIKLGWYLFRQKLRGRQRFPLTMILEPLEAFLAQIGALRGALPRGIDLAPEGPGRGGALVDDHEQGHPVQDDADAEEKEHELRHECVP